MNNVLLLLALLVCPISMGTMMFFMMRGQKKDEGRVEGTAGLNSHDHE